MTSKHYLGLAAMDLQSACIRRSVGAVVLLILLGAATPQARRHLLQDQQPDPQQPQHEQQSDSQRAHHPPAAWRSHCARFESLYESGIWEDTTFWRDGGGISEGLMGAAIGNLSLSNGTARRVGLPVAIVKGRLYLPEHVLLNTTVPWYGRNLLVWVHVLRRLTQRWGAAVPDVELLLAADDDPTQDTADSALWPAGPYWPVLRHCKSSQSADITIPTWHFYNLNASGRFFSQAERFNRESPWEAKQHRAYGGGLLYHRADWLPENAKQLEGNVSWEAGQGTMLREKFAQYLNQELKHPDIVFDAGSPIETWARNKMVIHLDGITCSSRVWQLLALGSVVLREQSNYFAFYDKQLLKYVHFVPFWQRRPREILWAYNWVTEHDEAARRIAARGQAFVREALSMEALECYWLLLLQQLARLQSYDPGSSNAVRKVKIVEDDDAAAAAASAAVGGAASAAAGGGSGGWYYVPAEEWLAVQDAGEFHRWKKGYCSEMGDSLELLPATKLGGPGGTA